MTSAAAFENGCIVVIRGWNATCTAPISRFAPITGEQIQDHSFYNFWQPVPVPLPCKERSEPA